MIEVTLPPELWKRGEAVGRARAKVKGNPAFEYDEETSEENHIYGARGEAAFAHALGLEWKGPVDTFTLVPDVEPNWEVRTTNSTNKLKVRPAIIAKTGKPGDDPSRLVVFVLNERGSPHYAVIGYIIAGGAQRDYPLRDTKDRRGRWRKAPVHWVRHYDLSPINPGFHAVHGWCKDDEGRWACAYCPEKWETP